VCGGAGVGRCAVWVVPAELHEEQRTYRERCKSSRAGETQKSDERSLLGEEAVASPSIGNTLWRTSTTFTRSAITPPELNGFG